MKCGNTFGTMQTAFRPCGKQIIFLKHIFETRSGRITNALHAAYECVTHNGKNSKQIVIIVRAVDASQAKMNALVQARQQFGSSAGSVTIVGCKEKH